MARRTITRIADIPIPRMTPAELFAVPRAEGARPPRYHGVTVVPDVELWEEGGDGARRTIEDAVVVKLHSYDVQRPEVVEAQDIDLGFWFDEDEWYEDDDPETMDFVVVARLSLVMERCLPRILSALESTGRPLVLCVCNRQRVRWAPPADWRGGSIWLPLGDTGLQRVRYDRATERYRATAERWIPVSELLGRTA